MITIKRIADGKEVQTYEPSKTNVEIGRKIAGETIGPKPQSVQNSSPNEVVHARVIDTSTGNPESTTFPSTTVGLSDNPLALFNERKAKVSDQ